MNLSYKKCHKLNQKHSQFEEIPIQIISDILSKLPTRTCLVCKLVCKDWYNIITDPEFAVFRRSNGCYTSVLFRGLINGSPNAIMLADIEKTSTSIIDDKGNVNTNDIDSIIELEPELVTEFVMVNECNGVILFADYEWDCCSYIICNMLTGQHAFLNKTHTEDRYDVRMVGIGCCPVSRELKLLRIVYHRERRYKSKRVAQVKTLGTDSEWRNVDKTSLPLGFHHGIRDSVYLNGSIHRYSRVDNCIWSFNFGTEEFSAIFLPDIIREKECSVDFLGCFDCCLCFNATEDPNNQSNIWVLKDYGVKDSWVKQFVFETDPLDHLRLWYIDKERVLVNCDDRSYGIRVCNVGSRNSEIVQVHGFSHVKATIFNPMFTKLQWSDEEEEDELDEDEIERIIRRIGRLEEESESESEVEDDKL